jgi:hypothetical protein
MIDSLILLFYNWLFLDFPNCNPFYDLISFYSLLNDDLLSEYDEGEYKVDFFNYFFFKDSASSNIFDGEELLLL